MAYGVAAVVSALIAFVELRTRLVSRPTLRGRAWIWWLGRLGLDAGIGVAAVTIIGTAGRPEWLTGVVAGIAGASLVRWQVSIPGEAGETRDVGIARAYDPLRAYFETTIIEIGAVEQQRWISETVLPQLTGAGVSVVNVADRIRWYVGAMSELDDDARHATLAFIDATIADAAPDEIKIQLLILHVITELRGYRVVKSFAKAAAKGSIAGGQ